MKSLILLKSEFLTQVFFGIIIVLLVIFVATKGFEFGQWLKSH